MRSRSSTRKKKKYFKPLFFLPILLISLFISIITVQKSQQIKSDAFESAGVWPKKYTEIDPQGGAFVDLDLDGKFEVVLTGIDFVNNVQNNVVKAYTLEGNLLWTFRLPGGTYLTDIAGNSTLAVGNVDADPTPEVIVASRELYSAGQLYILGSDSKIKWQTSIDPKTNGYHFWSVPNLTDIDKDKTLDIVIGFANNVRAYKGNGTMIWNRQTSADYAYPANSAVGDVDGNGSLEIVTGFWSSSASPRSQVVMTNASNGSNFGTPITLSGSLTQNLALANMDTNKDLEIIFSTKDTEKTYIYNHNGTLLNSGWPKNVAGFKAIGDINGDSLPDVVAVGNDYKLYAWNSSGTALPGWPITVTRVGGLQEAIISDIDTDSSPEILYAADCKVYAYELNGSLSAGYPKQFGGSCRNLYPVKQILIGTYNKAVYFLGLMSSVGSNYNSSFLFGILKDKGSTPALNMWPMYLRDARRTSFFLSSPINCAAPGAACGPAGGGKTCCSGSCGAGDKCPL